MGVFLYHSQPYFFGSLSLTKHINLAKLHIATSRDPPVCLSGIITDIHYHAELFIQVLSSQNQALMLT